MITGVILAGGQSTRMGGNDKGLMELHGIPLYQHVLSRLKNQVDDVIISANRNLCAYRQSGYPVISDIDKGFAGPLAGILTGMQAATSEWIVFVPCDVPGLPLDLVRRLCEAKEGNNAVYVTDGHRDHPTLLLINRCLIEPLKTYLHNGDRKLMLFIEQIGAKAVSFADQPNAFLNLNSPEDLFNWQRHHNEY